MGREAECQCVWGTTAASVKALLETHELILRGEVRKKIAFNEMRQIRADGEMLRFTVGDDSVSLTLGNSAATKWAQAITSPPTLAGKLGVTAKTRVQMLGPMDDEAVRTVLEKAANVSAIEGDLILARVDTSAELNAILDRMWERLAQGVPIWIIYPKGPGHDLNESKVINLVRAREMTDTKVAAVSSRLTGLRFVRRKS